MMSSDVLPPHDDEAEGGALGCVVTAEDPRMLAELRSDLFYDIRHQTIRSSLCDLRSNGRPLSVVELYQHLKQSNRLEDAGGREYVVALPEKAISASCFPSYLETIRNLAMRRAMVRDFTAAIGMAMSPDIPQATLADAVHRLGRLHYGNGSLPSIIDAAEFIRVALPTSPELVYGVLHQGSKMVFGGGSKTFKTWTLLDLAVAVAAGEPWLSFKTSKGRVLFVNFEIQPAFFQHRVRAVAEGKNVALAPGQLDVWNLRGHGGSYETIVPRIIERAGQSYVLVIVDPVYKLYGTTDENSAGDVGRLLNSLETLTAETGAAVAFGAHYAKGNAAGKEAIDRISGSGVFARDPDSIVNFTQHEQPGAFSVEMTLRNFKPVDPFVVRWQFPLMRRDDDLDPAKLKASPGRPRKHTPEKLLEVLKGQTLNTTNWRKICESEKGIPKSTFFELLDEAKATCPNLKQTQAGQWFYDDTKNGQN
jgi:hypothetical protein